MSDVDKLIEKEVNFNLFINHLIGPNKKSNYGNI
jgi:hypothetical protein